MNKGESRNWNSLLLRDGRETITKSFPLMHENLFVYAKIAVNGSRTGTRRGKKITQP